MNLTIDAVGDFFNPVTPQPTLRELNRVDQRRRYPRTTTVPLHASVNLPEPSGQVTAERLPLTRRNLADAPQIVAYLNELAWQFAQNPTVRGAAIEIISHRHVAENDIPRQASTIVQWVKDHVFYIRDPEAAEYIISPVIQIRNVAEVGRTYGDCDDHALLLASLLKAIDIPTKIIGVKLESPHLFDHVICSVQVLGQWHDVDPCAKGYVQPQYMSRLEV